MIPDSQTANGDSANELAVPANPAEFLILSQQHRLMPLAHRLGNVEKHTTQLTVWKKGWERSWGGMLNLSHRVSKSGMNAQVIAGFKEMAEAGTVVIHDIPQLVGEFPGSYEVVPQAGPSVAPIRLGWWQTQSGPVAPHLLLYDMGAQTGGLGRADTIGGLTLVVTENPLALGAFSAIVEQLDLGRFTGLANVGLVENGGDLVPGPLETGWPRVHTQAFLGNLAVPLGAVLLGEALPAFEQKFSLALPVSIPPWPRHRDSQQPGRAPRGVPIGLSEKLHGSVYWFDVEADTEARTLSTAGLDGLVGIVDAQAGVFETARQHALAVAGAIEVLDKQFRPDLGHNVQGVLAGLEVQFGIVI